jgi:hypothetical protein
MEALRVHGRPKVKAIVDVENLTTIIISHVDAGMASDTHVLITVSTSNPCCVTDRCGLSITNSHARVQSSAADRTWSLIESTVLIVRALSPESLYGLSLSWIAGFCSGIVCTGVAHDVQKFILACAGACSTSRAKYGMIVRKSQCLLYLFQGQTYC